MKARLEARHGRVFLTMIDEKEDTYMSIRMKPEQVDTLISKLRKSCALARAQKRSL